MTSKADKDKLKLVQDRCQHYLTDLLKDDDNKYCVDCDAKGPRWASWNLGVFLCIRCAGIHRNLGVHISKVKSVNLDAWTPEQIGHLQQMGNSKARAVYEANLPDNFRRPQTDSTLEAFIRSKYEQKKYIAKEWAPPPTPPPAFDIEEERKKEKEGKKKQRSTALTMNKSSGSPSPDVQTNSVPRPHSNPASTTISAEKVPKDVAKSSVATGSKSSSDLLGLGFDFPSSVTSDAPPSVTSTPVVEEDPFDAFVSASKSTNPPTAAPLSLAEEESDFFNQKVTDTKIDKDSILKMFDSNNFMSTTTAGPFAGNNPMTGVNNNFFSPAVNPVHQLSLLQNGTGHPVSNQAMMNPATNPFLASAPTGANIPTSSSSLFQDLCSLNLGSGPTANWMNSGAAHVLQSNSGFDQVNPFIPTAAPGQPASQTMFADFTQPSLARNPAEPAGQSLNWGLPAANPIEANRTLPSSDLWQ